MSDPLSMETHFTRSAAKRAGIPVTTTTTQDIEKLERELKSVKRLQQQQLKIVDESSAGEEEEEEYGPKNVLETLYHDPSQPGSFGGVDALWRAVKRANVQGITKNDIKKWLESQRAYTLHKPSRHKFERNAIRVYGVDEQFQADLADVSMLAHWNNGIHFWLTCICVFSKYAWVIPLRNKSATAVLTGFQRIFAERKPLKIQTDHGTEFTNSTVREYMEKSGVQQFFTWNPDIKAAVVERLNRTIKEKIWRYLTHENTYRYVDVLQHFVDAYNNSRHRSIGMTPTEASRPENEKKVWINLYGKRPLTSRDRIKFKYNLGDYVRISETRTVFRKGYRQRWTNEVFRVFKQSPRSPVVYRLEDLAGKPLVGSFYEQELQKVSEPAVKEIERILNSSSSSSSRVTGRYDRRGGHDIDFFIKFRGYPNYSSSRNIDNRNVEPEEGPVRVHDTE